MPSLPFFSNWRTIWIGDVFCAQPLWCRHGKFQLLPPAPPYYPFPRGNTHTRGNIWSFTVEWHEYCDPTGGAGALCNWRWPCAQRFEPKHVSNPDRVIQKFKPHSIPVFIFYFFILFSRPQRVVFRACFDPAQQPTLVARRVQLGPRIRQVRRTFAHPCGTPWSNTACLRANSALNCARNVLL